MDKIYSTANGSILWKNKILDNSILIGLVYKREKLYDTIIICNGIKVIHKGELEI